MGEDIVRSIRRRIAGFIIRVECNELYRTHLQLNFTLSLDEYTDKALYPLAPHMSTFSLDAPKKISSNLSIPKPVIASTANWLAWPIEETVSPEVLQRFNQIPTI